METSNKLNQDILKNLGNPKELEYLYRKDKPGFERCFNRLYPTFPENVVAQYWNERLNFKKVEIIGDKNNELLLIIIATIFAGLIAQIPQFFSIDSETFYAKNIAFIAFPTLIMYFSWKQKLGIHYLILPALSLLISVIYINSIPFNSKSDSTLLACIHLPIFLWSILGYSFLGTQFKSSDKRIQYLQFNGDLIVMCAILMLAGMLFSGMTMGLFNLIGFKIEELYFKYIAIWGLAAVPLVATYLVQNSPELVNKISPVIAKIFTPLVFILLLVFLITILYTGKDPYKDRDFLIVFNVLLIGVMTIILFSITEAAKSKQQKISLLFLFGLSLLTIIDNGIALSAIGFRLLEYGISPNRLAVLGSNLLIFINLLLVAHKLFLIIQGKCELEKVEKTIALFLPIYFIWSALVTFIFPLVFQFK